MCKVGSSSCVLSVEVPIQSWQCCDCSQTQSSSIQPGQDPELDTKSWFPRPSPTPKDLAARWTASHIGVADTKHTHTDGKVQNVRCDLHAFPLHKKIFISLNIDLGKKKDHVKKETFVTRLSLHASGGDVSACISEIQLSS